jgi:hypothetical protein
MRKFHYPGRRPTEKDFLFAERKHLISCGISTIMSLADARGRIDVYHPGNSAICRGQTGGVLVSRRLRRCRDANQAACGGAATKAGRLALCIVNNAAE